MPASTSRNLADNASPQDMRAGRLKHRITVLYRTGLPPVWTPERDLWMAIEPPRGLQRTQLREIGEIGLRYPMGYLMHCRRGLEPTAGTILRYKTDVGTRYFSVDTVSDQNEQGATFAVTCREFQGLPAKYHPRNNGEPYMCRGQPLMLNTDTNTPFDNHMPYQTSSITVRVELLVAELKAPYLQRGDRIEIQGMDLRVDGTLALSVDGYTVTAQTLNNVPAEAII